MSKLKAVIWDMDGTLVDTAELHFAAWAATAKKLDHPFTRDDFANTFGRRNPEVLRFLFGNDLTESQMALVGEEKEILYRAAAEQGVKLLSGAQALLDELKNAAFLQAIGSSAPRQNLDLILASTLSEKYFGAVVGMEDTKRGKPDPEVFLTAASKLGVEPANCVVLEDAPAGIKAAKAAGMKAIAITQCSQHSWADLSKSGADRVVKKLEDLTAKDFERLIA